MEPLATPTAEGRTLGRRAALVAGLLALACAMPSRATDWAFDWSTAAANWPLPGWTANAWPACGTTGTASNLRTYADVGGSGVDVRVTLTITAGCFETTPNFPSYSYAANGGSAGSPTDLDVNLNFTNRTTSQVTLLFEFFATGTTTPAPVAMTGIAMRDIDRQNNNWQDVLTMTAVDASGTTINPDFISQFAATPNWAPANPPPGTATISATGTNGIPATNPASWAAFVFGSQKIRSMTLLYTPGDGGGNTNPSQQRVYVSGFVFSDTAITTQAIVAGVRAVVEDGEPWVEWETASEVGTAGFNVYRRDADSGRYAKLNDRLLPSLVAAPKGGVYRYPDAAIVAGGIYTYAIEEVEATGRRRLYGPYTVVATGEAARTVAPRAATRAAAGRAIEPAARRPDRYTRRARAPDGRTGETPGTQRTVARQAAAVARAAAPANTAVRILVEKEGLYAVTADEIAAALGVNASQVRGSIARGQLRLAQKGRSVAWKAGPGNERLYFYGQPLDAPDSVHARHNVYWLEPGNGVSMSVRNGRGPTAPAAGQAFVSSIRAEENVLPAPFLAKDPDADFWFWNYVLVDGSGTEDARQFSVAAPGAIPGGTATLRAHLHGATNLAPGADHHAQVTVNGTAIGELAWDGIAPATLTATFPAGLLAAGGANTVTVRGTLDAGVDYSVFWVQGFDLDYPRAYEASNDRLRFGAAGHRVVTVGGFGSADVALLDVSDPRRPQWIAATTVTPAGGGYAVSFAPAKPTADYFAAVAGAPVAVEGASPPSLRGGANGAAYLVLTPRSLRAGADALAAHRSGKVVEIEDVYDVFGHGIANPHAIRDFLEYAYANWRPRPRHAALIGKGTFDPKDYLGVGANRFPVLMAATPDGLFASDIRYADFTDDGVPDIAIGRVPALSSDDVIRYVEKVGAYETNGSGAKRALVVADVPDDGGNFTADSRDVAQALEARGFATTAVELTAATDAADARQAIVDAINAPPGVGLWNYAGHGGVDVLSKTAVFGNADVALLANATHLPVFLAFTCAAGDGTYPGYDSLAETLLWRQGGGAVAAIAPTGLSDNGQAHTLNMSLVGTLAGARASATLGEANAAALADFARKGAERYMLEKYSVTGDPGLRVRR